MWCVRVALKAQVEGLIGKQGDIVRRVGRVAGRTTAGSDRWVDVLLGKLNLVMTTIAYNGWFGREAFRQLVRFLVRDGACVDPRMTGCASHGEGLMYGLTLFQFLMTLETVYLCC